MLACSFQPFGKVLIKLPHTEKFALLFSGGRPWHLRYIIDRVEDKSRIGYCIDTCHLFSSGLFLQLPCTRRESCPASGVCVMGQIACIAETQSLLKWDSAHQIQASYPSSSGTGLKENGAIQMRVDAAGKDLRTVEDCEATFQEIDEVVGLEYLRVPSHPKPFVNLPSKSTFLSVKSHQKAYGSLMCPPSSGSLVYTSSTNLLIYTF